MSWPATFGVAIVTALVGMIAAGYAASLATSWYRIPDFEGQSGYFIGMLGIAGLVLGFVVGVVVARIVTGDVMHAAAAALGVMLALLVLIAVPARLLADVPPAIGGDPLLLAVEYRWPSSYVEAPTAGEDDPHVRLGSLSGAVERKAVFGAFWLEDSRREEGRWISPAAVQLFTERGRRTLSFVAADGELPGVIVPLPRRPGARHLEWSDWLPADTSGSPDGASYRFRVHRSSEPIRVEQFGPFAIEMRAAAFWLPRDPAGRDRIDATAAFTIRHHGEPVVIEHPGMYGSTASPRIERASAVAVVDAPRPALLACMIRYDRPCFLLVSEDAGVRTEYVAEVPTGMAGFELTADPARYERSTGRTWPRTGLQRNLFEHATIYQLGAVLLDTRGPRLVPLTGSPDVHVQQWRPPVGLAPDGRAFVRIGANLEDETVLVVADVDGSNAYTLPVDASDVRDGTWDEISPSWVMQHYNWVRDGSGSYRLVKRSGSVPLRGD